jgi:hypothetical protein
VAKINKKIRGKYPVLLTEAEMKTLFQLIKNSAATKVLKDIRIEANQNQLAEHL